MSLVLLQLRCNNRRTQVEMCAGGFLLCQDGPDWAELRRFYQNRAKL